MFIKHEDKNTDLIPHITQGSCVLFNGKYRFVGAVQKDEVLLVHNTEEPVIVHPSQCLLAPGFWEHVE